MISRSIIVFLVLTFTYYMLLSVMPILNYQAVNQKQSNIIAKEEYVLSQGSNADIVMVGSSLTYRMKNNFLPSNYWNLAMGGSSFSEGIEIIKSTKNLPRIVLIETNIMDLPIYNLDTGITESISTLVHDKIVVNRTKNKFVDYLVNLAFQIKNRNKPKTSVKGKVDEKAKKFMYEYREEQYSTIPDSTVFYENISYLKKNISWMQDRGICVILFEMPIDCQLSESLKVSYIRNAVSRLLPQNEYDHLRLYNCHSYETTDGIHLDEASAISLAETIVKDISVINCN